MKSAPEVDKVVTDSDQKLSAGAVTPGALDPFIHVVIKTLCCDSLKRLEGRSGIAIPFIYKSPMEDMEARKMYSIHLFYQMLIGSIGGVATGIETGFIAFNRIQAPPNTPFPPKWRLFNGVAEYFLRRGSVIWSISKRAVVAGFMFDMIDKNMEQGLKTSGWLNFGIAGVTTGFIFGLRGGWRGATTSAAGFGFFATLAGFFFHFEKPPGDEK